MLVSVGSLRSPCIGLRPEEFVKRASEFLPMIPPERFPYLNGLSQAVIAGRHDGLHDFEFGLDLILDGLERLLAR